MDKHKQAYREEAQELLAELEAALLELEEHPQDHDLVCRVFRAMHTVKGSGAMFGFDDIAEFTHEIETVFDHIREGKRCVDKHLIDLTLSACDIIKKMVNSQPVETGLKDSVSTGFRAVLTDDKNDVPGQAPSPFQAQQPCGTPDASVQDPGVSQGLLTTFRIRFSPDESLFVSGTNPLRLIEELLALGRCHVYAHTRNIPELSDLNPEGCHLFWDIILTTRETESAVRDVFIFVEDACRLDIACISDENAEAPFADEKRLGEILLERGDIQDKDLVAALDRQKRLGEVLTDSGLTNEEAIDAALAEQAHIKKLHRTVHEEKAASSLRVASDKLDRLVDLVGELVTVQASLSQKASLQVDPELVSISEEIERLTGELRDNTMGIRMMPIGSTFSKFKRLVRDLSGELEKNIVLETDGGETELDKTVLERLNDPLVHIIRNCVGHGIESPGVRKSCGKPEQGRIHISAVHSGAHVLIKIVDDGRGINIDTVREKAIDKGIVSAEDELSDSDIYALLFAPGFSTAKTVTDISGRGVGMDVVKKSIESLRGTIELHSTPGAGTTVLLKLPLTLAIIEGLLVEIEDANYVIPLTSVEECVELSRSQLKKKTAQHIFKVRDELIPYVSLRRLFNIEGRPPDIEQIVIVELDGCRIGFVVDQVIGKHQTVIKNLGTVYRHAKGFSGATILADGSVALILDVNSLSEVAKTDELAA